MSCKRKLKKTKKQDFMYSDTVNVEHEMYIILVIIGATRIVTQGLKKNLESIPGKHSIDSLGKTAILGT
jgi:hypothetical protein